MASGSMPALSALLVKGDVACDERIYFRGVLMVLDQLNWNCWLGDLSCVLLFCWCCLMGCREMMTNGLPNGMASLLDL